MNFMVEPKKGTKWPKELPRFSSRPDAIAVCKELCNIQYIHRSEKVAKGELEVRSRFAFGSIISVCTLAAFYRVAKETIFPCPIWCYLLPRVMLRDSSYSDVIGSGAFGSWIELLLGGSGPTTFYKYHLLIFDFAANHILTFCISCPTQRYRSLECATSTSQHTSLGYMRET